MAAVQENIKLIKALHPGKEITRERDTKSLLTESVNKEQLFAASQK